MPHRSPGQDAPAGFPFRPYRDTDEVHDAMARVRLGCADRDGVDARSVVEGLPTAQEIADASAALEEPSRNQVLVTRNGDVVGYATIRWWRERDGTWLYLHRGYLLPEHRRQGVGSAMLSWAEERIRRLVEHHGTARTAVIGANATASEQDATDLLLTAGYRRVFSLVELELADLGRLPEQDAGLPAGIRTGPIGPNHYRAAWRTVVDSYAGTGFTQEWPFQDFAATADPACWRAAWNGQDMVGAALCSLRPHDRTLGEVEELSIRTDHRRLGIGRALLLDGLRSLREHGATTARLFTGTANPHRSYDLYEGVGFQRRNEYVRYRRPLV
ncbi:GNAT family N-acetyltransferase [Streptomyces sp. ADI93-02]|uniref:GNAT family N-acetyltransferase n=1 Tax=Streptomyces sp. ADI93-02 TaxID=1522757 RepID=UPI000F553A83|nr:GNAT family N-acetyltransferase [Streptomyces sp. ADI93-02]RPK44332.1 aminoalkylphosphonic acid N-acetyltransferase [Streptomyces sp. ADI93-02]